MMKEQRIGDIVLVAFYFLLRVGKYTSKLAKKGAGQGKQTVQFRMKDVTFFKFDKLGLLLQIARNAPNKEIMQAVVVTLHLSNQKNGWKKCFHTSASKLGCSILPSQSINKNLFEYLKLHI